jgi:hypothetical protein
LGSWGRYLGQPNNQQNSYSFNVPLRKSYQYYEEDFYGSDMI